MEAEVCTSVCVQAGSKVISEIQSKIQTHHFHALSASLSSERISGLPNVKYYKTGLICLLWKLISLHGADTTKWSERIFFHDSLEVNPKELCCKVHAYWTETCSYHTASIWYVVMAQKVPRDWDLFRSAHFIDWQKYSYWILKNYVMHNAIKT